MNLKNKIYYESEMHLNELIDNTVDKIDELKEWMLHNKNENVCDALQEIVEAEKCALKFVLDWLTKH